MYTEKSEQEKLEEAFIASVVKLLTDRTWDTNWNLVSGMFMFSDEAEETYRLFRSQMFQDPDYPDRVHEFLKVAHSVDSDRAIAMMVYIIQEMMAENLVNQYEINRYPVVKAFLERKDVSDFAVAMPKVRKVKYLDIKELPDDFYYNLAESINKSFAYGIHSAVDIMARKILENLLVDILRKKFAMREVELFFDKDHGRFHGFNVLLKNFRDRLNEFKPVIPTLDLKFIDKLNSFREEGNSAAHTLELEISEAELEAKKDELQFVVKTLVRLYRNI